MSIKIKDDKHKHLKGFDAIRACMGMYNAHTGVDAALHLLQESTDNHNDELSHPESIGTDMTVVLEEETGIITTTDDGRGIPFDKMQMLLEEIHSSSKFGREYNKRSTGQNGVGLKLIIATSDWCEVTSIREGKMRIMRYDDAVLTKDEILDAPADKHGTVCRFKPSERFLGKFKLKSDHVTDRLRHMSYLIDKHIEIKFQGIKKNGKVSNQVFTFKNGMLDCISDITENKDNIIAGPFFFEDHIADDFMIRVAFMYVHEEEHKIQSYCNFRITSDGGTHNMGVRDGIASVISKESDNDKMSLTLGETLDGLVIAIDVTHPNPEFGGRPN